MRGLTSEAPHFLQPRYWLVLAVRGYQVSISPLLPATCRYHPSCSAYAVQALERHGALRGSWLAARRILRCNPFVPGGYDPVPDVTNSSNG